MFKGSDLLIDEGSEGLKEFHAGIEKMHEESAVLCAQFRCAFLNEAEGAAGLLLCLFALIGLHLFIHGGLQK